jgi:4-hydroxy 2-oxovalerate aldolase
MTARLTAAQRAGLVVVDSTLRDGSHAISHQFTTGHAAAVAGALQTAGVPVIEVSHGDGLGGSSLSYGRSANDELALVAAAAEAAPDAAIAVLLLPGIGVGEDLRRARDAGARMARVATHCTEADVGIQHLGLARDLGLTAVGFLMMAHRSGPEELAGQARIMADAGAQVVYVTDSAGALTPAEVRDRVAALRATLPAEVAIGIHAHHNLNLSVGNSLAAVEAGATWIDGCLAGMGAGGGNTPTESLVAALGRGDRPVDIALMPLLDAADDIVRPLLPRPLTIDREVTILGVAGVYSSFLRHAERAAERFAVPVAEILLEAGRREAVGGQEDLLIEIAAELSTTS